jgi:hypothetical protein
MNILFICNPFCNIGHHVQVDAFKKNLLKSTLKMGFLKHYDHKMKDYQYISHYIK